MATSTLDLLGLAMRSAGVSLFVLLAPPFGLLRSWVMPEGLQWPGVPALLVLILMGCIHVYFMSRAYYALRIIGILVLTIIYLLFAYYLAVLLGVETDLSGTRWLAIFYLSLLYAYGVCYNFIDSFISGLLHTKVV